MIIIIINVTKKQQQQYGLVTEWKMIKMKRRLRSPKKQHHSFEREKRNKMLRLFVRLASDWLNEMEESFGIAGNFRQKQNVYITNHQILAESH